MSIFKYFSKAAIVSSLALGATTALAHRDMHGIQDGYELSDGAERASTCIDVLRDLHRARHRFELSLEANKKFTAQYHLMRVHEYFDFLKQQDCLSQKGEHDLWNDLKDMQTRLSGSHERIHEQV